MNEIIVLDNGIKLSYAYIPYIHTVSTGCYFGAGSRYETERNNGISHFIEHNVFKGTKKRSAFDLVCDVDKIGANMNAYTGKETTCYYIQGLAEQFEVCLEILSDMVCNHTYPEDEIEKEKEVVIEEIKMCEDTPDDLCHELASKSYWGNHPLSLPILGNAETVRSFIRQDLIDYEQQRYVSENLVISVVGNIDRQTVIDLVGKYFADFRKGKVDDKAVEFVKSDAQVVTSIKPNEQANVCLTFDGVSASDKDKDVVGVLCTCFGGNMSSVLFHRLREEMSLAYSVFAYSSKYSDNGSLSIYIGTSPEKVKTALTEIKKIIDEYMQHGFSKEEFVRGVNQMKSAYVMGLESSTTLMRVYADRTLLSGEPFDIDKKLALLDAITLDDLNRVFKKCFSSVPTIGYVGTEQDFDLQEVFKRN